MGQQFSERCRSRNVIAIRRFLQHSRASYRMHGATMTGGVIRRRRSSHSLSGPCAIFDGATTNLPDQTRMTARSDDRRAPASSRP